MTLLWIFQDDIEEALYKILRRVFRRDEVTLSPEADLCFRILQMKDKLPPVFADLAVDFLREGEA